MKMRTVVQVWLGIWLLLVLHMIMLGYMGRKVFVRQSTVEDLSFQTISETKLIQAANVSDRVKIALQSTPVRRSTARHPILQAETKQFQIANVSVRQSTAGHPSLLPALDMQFEYMRPHSPSTLAQTRTNASTSKRKIVFCFPYNGEKMIVRQRITLHPEALFVVSESLYGHNGGVKKQLYWPLHFPEQASEYIQHNQNRYDASSADGVWAQETSTRRILGRGVRNLYGRAEIGDNDIVVVTDADEIVSTAALAWLQTHLRDGELAVADFQWFLYTHCYQHPKITSIKVAVTVKTLRLQFNWDAHKVRSTNTGIQKVHIDVTELSSHCSWCMGNSGIREKMRLNIEGSSWQSRGHSYVFTDAELNRLRLSGTWFDGNLHGRRQCTTEQIIAEMATHDNAA